MRAWASHSQRRPPALAPGSFFVNLAGGLLSHYDHHHAHCTHHSTRALYSVPLLLRLIDCTVHARCHTCSITPPGPAISRNNRGRIPFFHPHAPSGRLRTPAVQRRSRVTRPLRWACINIVQADQHCTTPTDTGLRQPGQLRPALRDRIPYHASAGSVIMDSMRHLSSSLPTTRRRNEQTHQLLSDFKAAALSVTNLYKTAAAENTRAREAGYQDALDDLLAFLDKENLGLMDGEGWRVRRWATERLDDGPKASEDEDDGGKEEVADTRSSSPEAQRKPMGNPTSSDLVEEEQQRRASEPPQHAPQPQHQNHAPTQAAPATSTPAPALEDFSFRSAQAYPTNHNREDGQTMDVDPASNNTVRVAPKASSRSRHTRNRDSNRTSTGPTFNFNLGSGAGSKRKMPYPDFFDISGLNPDGNDTNRKDGGGRGGKKGRHV